jgi:hypothetical protein
LEEHITSTFKVKEQDEQETSMKAGGKHSHRCENLKFYKNCINQEI